MNNPGTVPSAVTAPYYDGGFLSLLQIYPHVLNTHILCTPHINNIAVEVCNLSHFPISFQHRILRSAPAMGFRLSFCLLLFQKLHANTCILPFGHTFLMDEHEILSMRKYTEYTSWKKVIDFVQSVNACTVRFSTPYEYVRTSANEALASQRVYAF